jgi:hypothetical protein
MDNGASSAAIARELGSTRAATYEMAERHVRVRLTDRDLASFALEVGVTVDLVELLS